MQDIEVRLYDIKNNEILKDKNNSEIIEKTKKKMENIHLKIYQKESILLYLHMILIIII